MNNLDHHHHIVLEEVADLISESAVQAWHHEESIEFLKRHNLDSAVLSLYHPALPVSDREAWVNITRTYNRAAAEIKKRYPKRFRVFAAIPYPHIEESIEEIRYALDGLRLDGVCVFPVATGRRLDDEKSVSVLRELNERKAVVFVHPVSSEGIPIENESYLDSVLFITGTMFNDRLKLCPNVRFILSHTGGTIPFLSENIGLLSYYRPKRTKWVLFSGTTS